LLDQLETQPHVELTLPLPDGSRGRFALEVAPTMDPVLAARYPEIGCYRGVGLDDPRAQLRLDLSPDRLQVMVLSPHGDVFIDPLLHAPGKEQARYQCYGKADLSPWQDWHCEVEDAILDRQQATSVLSFSGEVRSYRLAVSTTGEYSQFHGGTIPQVLSAVVAVINRVNGLYERDAGVTLQLIAETDQCFFFNAGTDPFTNNSSFALLSENQSVIDGIIGNANYDIGHVFSTGGGGVARFRSVCDNGDKARGVTGLPAPIGDPFAIDYVAHEIGHQFGGSHTFNGTTGSCSGNNRVGSAAYEPGSGSTIMAYAGICPGQNIQSNSDAHFHAFSIQQIYNFTRIGGAASCASVTTDANQPPVAQARYDGLVLPLSTPFRLIGSAVDPDLDALTYCWEQWNLGPAGSPGGPAGDAPIIRSRAPVDSGVRIVPRIGRLVTNSFDLGEILPTYARDLDFRLTVRDQVLAGAGLDVVEVNYTVTDEAGPFLVTFPNTPTTWAEGTFQTVTWDVANTDQLPVNCQYVDVLLSTDGGFTYPITLADSVPNDGAEPILVPGVPGNQNRIMVAAADHFFLDISNQNFGITAATGPGYNLSSIRDTNDLCVGDSATFQWLTSSFGGFNSALSLTPTGAAPSGLQLRTEPAPFVPGDTLRIVMSLDSGMAAPGAYQFALVLNGGGVVRSLPVTLNYLPGPPVSPAPLFPLNGQAGRTRRPLFQWQASPSADRYHLAISQSATMSAPTIFDGIIDTFFTLPTFLDADQVYYWLVWGENACGEGPFSPTQVMRTGRCDTASSQDGPVLIPAFSNPGVALLDLTLPQDVTVGDVNVWDITGTHPAMNELSVQVRKAGQSSSSVSLYLPTCGSGDAGFQMSFDDEATRPVSCPPVSSEVFVPAGTLSDYQGQPSGLNWELVVRDDVLTGGGTLDRWTLEVCAEGPEAPTLTNLPLELGNATSRLITNANLAATATGSSATDIVFTLQHLPLHGTLLLNSQPLGVGATFTQAQIDQAQLSYQHDSTLTLTDAFDFTVEGLNGSWLGGQTFLINIWAVGIEDTQGPAWEVFPNPARTSLQVSIPARPAGPCELTLLDLQGRRLRTQSLVGAGPTKVSLSVSDLSAGLYVLRLQGDTYASTQRVIIAR
jgi:hypothetical protein